MVVDQTFWCHFWGRLSIDAVSQCFLLNYSARLFLNLQALGSKARGKNMCITLTHLSRLTVVIVRTLRVCKIFFGSPFDRVTSVLQALGGKMRTKNLHITLTQLRELTTVVIEALRV